MLTLPRFTPWPGRWIRITDGPPALLPFLHFLIYPSFPHLHLTPVRLADPSQASNHGCSSSKVGYDVTSVTGARLDHQWTNDTVNNLTKVLVLHPVAAGIAFFAFLVTLCADRLGFICAAFIAFLAFVVSLVAMIFDFVVFGIVKHEITNNTTGSADYGSATWMTLAATIILFFAIFIVFFSCCTGMRNKKREHSNGYNNGGYVGNAGPEMGYATSRPWYSRFTNRNKY